MSEAVTPRRAATRERLMDAAVVMFAEKGVLGATVEEICEQAGFSRGAFYSNFDSKDDLCLAVIQRQGLANLTAAQRVTAEATALIGTHDLDELIDGGVAMFAATQPQEPAEAIATIELRLYAARNPAVRAAVNAISEQLSETFAAVLSAAFEAAGARSTIPMPQAIDLLYGACQNAALSAIIGGRETPREVLTRQLAAIIRGVTERDADPPSS